MGKDSQSHTCEPGCVLKRKWVKENPSFSKTSHSSLVRDSSTRQVTKPPSFHTQGPKVVFGYGYSSTLHQPFINPSTQRCHVLPGLHLSSAVLWKAHFFKRFQEPLHSVRVETENSGGWVSLGQIPKSGDATCHTLYALDEIWGWKQPSWRIRGWG